MSIELSVQCRLARDYTMENIADTLAYLLIKLEPNSAVQSARLPINLSLVIDVSRSMKGDKINFAREAAKLLVTLLNADDWVSVVTFSDESRVVVPATRAAEKQNILSFIDRIQVESGTRMFLGMDAGALEIQRTASPNQNKRMILLTDGETEGEDMCRNSASRNAYLPATGCGSGLQSHMSISTLGVGKKYNEDLLSKIAEITIGRFYHLNDPGQIGGILQREFYNASGSVISRAKLNLMLEDGVRLETLDIIYPGSVRLQPVSEAGGKVLTAGLGSLQGEQATILGAQLKLPLQPAGRRQIAGVSVNYSIPGLNIEDRVENSSVFVEYTGDASLCSRVDREVISYFNQVSTQKLVEQAITESRQGNITAATRSLAQAQEITQRLGNLPLAQTIKDAREELTQKGTISEEGLKTIKSGSRFTVKLDKNTIRKI